MSLSLKTVQRALQLEEFDGLAAQLRMKPVPRAERRPRDREGDARQGAVLILLYSADRQIYVVLTRRHDDLATHAGQISLPGGRREGLETLQETALREAHEEVGVRPADVTILGELMPLYIPPSDFEVHPFVGWHEQKPAFVPQEAEVAEIIEVPLDHLLQAGARQEEIWDRQGISMQIPFFRVGSHKVWGATAMILSEFVERLQAESGRRRRG